MFLKEDIHTEYKEASNNRLPKSVWETVSAFANTDGGTIVLGVRENVKEKTFNVVGVTNPDKLKTDFLNLQKDKDMISRAIIKDNNFEVQTIDGLTILNIYVPKLDFNKRPLFLKNLIKNSYIRENESDRKINDEELRFFLREADTDIDADLLNNYDLNDLNLVDIQNYQALLADKTGNKDILTSDYMHFLNSIGLIQKDRSVPDGKYKLKKAALLLFGKFNSIIEQFPNFFIDFIIKPTSSDLDYTDRVYTSSEPNHPNNIYSFFSFVSDKLRVQITNKFKLDGITRTDDADILFYSLREALVNTLIHADYSSKTPIKISLYNDYIVFKNPGDMRVSTERFMLGGESVPRNPNIFNTFIRAKLGEHTGSGGHRIFENSEKLKLRNPEIYTDIKNTELSIWTIPLEESVLANLPSEWQSTYKFLSKHLVATYSDLQHLYLSPYYGHKILGEMIQAKLINKVGERKGTKYLISQSSPAAKLSINSYIRSVQHQLLNKK